MWGGETKLFGNQVSSKEGGEGSGWHELSLLGRRWKAFRTNSEAIWSISVKHSQTSRLTWIMPGFSATSVRGSDLLPQLFYDGQQLRIFSLGHLAVPCSLCVVTQQLAVLGGSHHTSGRQVDAPNCVDGGCGHVHSQVRFVRHPLPTPGRAPAELPCTFCC